MATVLEELHHLIDRLAPDEQARVLIYARELAQTTPSPRSPRSPRSPTPLPPGTPGHVVAQLSVSPEVGEAMEQALADCERIPPDEEGADEYQW